MNIKAPKIEGVTLILSYKIPRVNIPRRLPLDALASFFEKKPSEFDNVRNVLSCVKNEGNLEKYEVNGSNVTFWFTFTETHVAHKFIKEAKGYTASSSSIALELSYPINKKLAYPSTEQTSNLKKLQSFCLEKNSEEPYLSLVNLSNHASSCKASLLGFRVRNAYKKVSFRFKFGIADAKKFVSAFCKK